MAGLGAKKQILVVGNDGVHLYVLRGKTVSLYQDFSNSGFSLTSDLKVAFKAVNLPLIVLFDVVEQQYRRETIPKVNFMDKTKVINRKLAMAFPQQLFRAALLSKKPPKEGENNIALFAGLSANLTITQIMDALLGSEVYIEGAALLPLESISLVNKIVAENHKKIKSISNSRWSVLMTHHQSGGLRQIVTKDGELALTRMTPLAAGLEQAGTLADEMVREFNATLTYLARFGYVPADGLDLYVVATPEINEQMGKYRLPVTDMYPLSLGMACQYAGLKVAQANNNQEYSEILHAGWVGLQSKLFVPLSSPLLDKVKNARQSARLLIFALLVGVAYMGWQTTNLQSAVSNLDKDVETQQTQKISLQKDFDDLQKSLPVLKYDVEKTKAILSVYDDNYKKSLDVHPTLNAILPLIDHKKFLLKDISITQPGSDTPGAAKTSPPPMPMPTAAGAAGSTEENVLKKQIIITMEIIFPDDVAVEQAARNTLEFSEALKKRFPGRTINIKQMIGDLALDKTVQGKSEKENKGQAPGSEVSNKTSIIEFKGLSE